MNMGTPGNPEGVAHWTNKSMYAQQLEGYRRRQLGFWLFYNDCCSQCEGGGFVENILVDVTAVKLEADYGPYRPDILLERGDKPPIWIEFTDTSHPSMAKLEFCERSGIDVFELDGSKRPIESNVLKAHISTHNCRRLGRNRLVSLWDHMASLEEPVVGIQEDFRSAERKRKDSEVFSKKFDDLKESITEGNVICARCSKPFIADDEGFRVSEIVTHRPDGSCGQVFFCDKCDLSIRGGWDGNFPEDAALWGLKEGCPTCEPLIAEETRLWESLPFPRSVEMPAPYGSRLVNEPQRRVQQYIVGNRTVSRDELQSVLMMFQYVLVNLLPATSSLRMMGDHISLINRSILFANGVTDWDWLEGIGDSYVPEYLAPDDHTGDRMFNPKLYWPEFPPACPLMLLGALPKEGLAT